MMKPKCSKPSVTALAACLSLLFFMSPNVQAVDFVFINADPPGVGFNDQTPATPVGGNPGATVGEQRQEAFKKAFELWGRILRGTVPIEVEAQFSGLECNATGGVLGAAGAYWSVRDVTGAPRTGTWYVGAEANQFAGEDLYALPEIIAFFNGDLGTTGCIEGASWYYGFDHKEPTGSIDFLAVLMHELAHGLGFANQIDESTGGLNSGYPDAYSTYTYDRTLQKGWNDMTDAERVSSATNADNVVWSGMGVTTLAPGVLERSTAVKVAGTDLNDTFDATPASFGPPLNRRGVRGRVVQVIDGGGESVNDACEPLTLASSTAVKGKIALVDRGSCTFVTKVLNAQTAGAIGVIIVNNEDAGTPPMGGSDPSVTIPSVGITKADGQVIKTNLPGVRARMGKFGDHAAGTSPEGQVLLYTPSTLQLGSSVSHWDTKATPNLLMEPSINSDLMEEPLNNVDLTSILLLDIGWKLRGINQFYGKIRRQCSALSGTAFVDCFKEKASTLRRNRLINRTTYKKLVRRASRSVSARQED